jgi:hypothetical protein
VLCYRCGERSALRDRYTEYDVDNDVGERELKAAAPLQQPHETIGPDGATVPVGTHRIVAFGVPDGAPLCFAVGLSLEYRKLCTELTDVQPFSTALQCRLRAAPALIPSQSHARRRPALCAGRSRVACGGAA